MHFGLLRRFLFRYENNRTYTISIPKRTDFVTKIRAMRSRKSGYAILLRLIRSFLLSRAELRKYYSVHSGIRIGSKRTQSPPIPYDSYSGIVPKERALKYSFASMRRGIISIYSKVFLIQSNIEFL